MNIKVVGKNIEITAAIKEYIEKRVERLEKFEAKNTEVTVVCSVEREEQIVEIQINQNGEFIRIEEKNNDLYASVDLAIDKAERQLRKEKEKRVDKNREESLKEKVLGLFKGGDEENIGKVTKTKCYDLKPITLEDAKLKLEDEKDTLFMPFVNVETKEVNVLYKREDGSYGIVVPE
ncbi:MAG: ribosome-associated translation inhibitor RaiA [Clostridia bacterium]|nr:ribosome-associated translation inhibitor RaiA [Clostridia bacterium]